MLARLGEQLAAGFRATAPDPFVLAILLTMVTFALAIFASGPQTVAGPDGVETVTAFGAKAILAVEYWQGGFWDLLAFGMQMCLILVTGHALASSPPIARAIRWIACTPKSPGHAVALVAFVAIAFGLVNWGLGLIVGAIMARDVGVAMRERGGAQPPYALLAAAGYAGMLTWHGGLSGSAPLAAAQQDQLTALLGAPLAERVGGLPVSSTLFTNLNYIATGGLLVIVPVLLALMCPREGTAELSACTPPPEAQPLAEKFPKPSSVPEWLERTPWVALLLAAPGLVWLAMQFAEKGLDALTLNTANLLFLSIGLVLHGSAIRYADAIQDGARGCAGIILQFPIYAGIMGIMRESGLAVSLSEWFVSVAGGNEGALAGLTFVSAGLVNLFVPSGGGQWAVQAPIAMQAAVDAGASPAKMVMAVSYGDQLTNMLQPFWALPLLAITGVKAREIVGYTAIVMVAAGAWLAGCLLVL